MSHELVLAVALPGAPLIGAVIAVALVAIVVMLVRKSRKKSRTRQTWIAASEDLGIQFVANGSDLGAVARGRVNEHTVSISPARRGNKKRLLTQYTVKFEAPEAPEFNLVKRIDETTPIVDTGNPKFDAVVTVQTSEPESLQAFLTAHRRSAILRLLTYFPAARITNSEAHLLTLGIEDEQDKLVDAICHLVAAAETFDRALATEEETTASDAHDLDAASTSNEHVADDSQILTEVRLDEANVLNALFNAGFDDAAMTAHFEQVYRGREVSWTGEVVRVAPSERGMQRVAAFVGSADGVDPASGRVVALAAVKAEPLVVEGDVVSFSGSLGKLDVAQRLFHVV